ncbi:uncharacterized protein LOC119085378 [Bradysia coprophila]|uniref:uncharacterized protein LOC119085378 n=1 Tax=Bradysia coprophila TaxID=38358 RepID=UPI00187DD938|nr:uncharacterized protein LOC119085378 [Bradysia coprophila]
MEININTQTEAHEEKAFVSTMADDAIDAVRKRVMSIPELRRHIFNFLPLESIKACRLVCHDWDSTAGPLMIATSQIRFRNYLDEPERARLPDQFIRDFSTGSLLEKCDKFCFYSPENWIEYDDMLSFIDQFGGTMKELTIFGTYIRNALYTLTQKNLIKLIPSQLTKLEVVTDRVKTKLIVSIDRLENIKTLRLGGCILKIIDGAVCAPVELRLKNVFFLRNRKDFQETVKLNELFDFRNLKDLHVDCRDTENIELSLSDGALKLSTLNLNRVKILNWESAWTVGKLTLCKKAKITTASGMKYEELDFAGSVLDFAALPVTIKSLAVNRLNAKLLHIESAQNLVNLKCLTLHRKRYSLLTAFQNCANLTHLDLYPMDEGDVELVTIDVKLIPKTVKVLRLRHDCELLGKIDFELETVIIEQISFDIAYDFLVENLNVKNALLYCSNFTLDADHGTEIDKVIEGLTLQRFIVGPFFRSEPERYAFSYYPFLERDMAKADFFVKTDQDAAVIKKQITKTEFNRLGDAWWTNESISF